MEAARLAPDGLAEAVHVDEFAGADRDGVERRQQAEFGQFADRMRQRVDADADLSDFARLLVDGGTDAARVQHQGERETANAASDDDDLHADPPGLIISSLKYQASACQSRP